MRMTRYSMWPRCNCDRCEGLIDKIDHSPEWRHMETYIKLHRWNIAWCHCEVEHRPPDILARHGDLHIVVRKLQQRGQGRKYRRRKEAVPAASVRGGSKESRDWTEALLTIIRPCFNYCVRRQDEFKIDVTPFFEYSYTYYWQCTTPQTGKVVDRIGAAAHALPMELKICWHAHYSTKAYPTLRIGSIRHPCPKLWIVVMYRLTI